MCNVRTMSKASCPDSMIIKRMWWVEESKILTFPVLTSTVVSPLQHRYITNPTWVATATANNRFKWVEFDVNTTRATLKVTASETEHKVYNIEVAGVLPRINEEIVAGIYQTNGVSAVVIVEMADGKFRCVGRPGMTPNIKISEDSSTGSANIMVKMVDHMPPPYYTGTIDL